jgi:hypothetical protein
VVGEEISLSPVTEVFPPAVPAGVDLKNVRKLRGTCPERIALVFGASYLPVVGDEADASAAP